jgi:hypothetical protein
MDKRKLPSMLCLLLAAVLLCPGCPQQIDEPETVSLESIAVSKEPDKTEYVTGQTFAPEGLEITGTYSDGSAKPETGYDLSEPDMESEGEKTVTVTLDGKTATFTITIRDATLESIAVTKLPDKTLYFPGAAFDPEGLEVTGTYSDGVTVRETGYDLSEPDMDSEGEKTVIVTLGGKTAEFTIEVEGSSLVSITIAKPPNKTTYAKGEPFDSFGLEVTGTYEDGEVKPVTGGIHLSSVDTDTEGDKTVTVTIIEKTAAFTITVGPAKPDILEITPPDKTLYGLKEPFTTAGLEVAVVYTDGTRETVTDYTTKGGATGTAGEKTVTVTWNKLSAEFTIVVTDGVLQSLVLSREPDKLIYFQGEDIDANALAGLEVKGKYSDTPSLVRVDVGLEHISGYDKTKLGQQTLTITVGSFACAFTIEVIGGTAELHFDNGYRRTNLSSGVIRYTVPLGRTLVLAPVRWFIPENAAFTWKVDGVSQAAGGLYFSFTPTEKKRHRISVSTGNGASAAEAFADVDCVDPEGTYKRTSGGTGSTGLFSCKAPGQFTGGRGGDGGSFSVPRSSWYSLGMYGGYAVFQFGRSIDNDPGKYSITIDGNGSKVWSEPGIVWVMQDEDGNGLADDTWYELKGSETGTPNAEQRCAFKIVRPLPGQRTAWYTNDGGTGVLPGEDYYGNTGAFPELYGEDKNADWVIFTGTRLSDKVTMGGMSYSIGFDWGYVDNGAPITFRISDAIQADGSPIHLDYIDFVKVQCGVLAYAGALGEISTEICNGNPRAYIPGDQ